MSEDNNTDMFGNPIDNIVKPAETKKTKSKKTATEKVNEIIERNYSISEYDFDKITDIYKNTLVKYFDLMDKTVPEVDMDVKTVTNFGKAIKDLQDIYGKMNFENNIISLEKYLNIDESDNVKTDALNNIKTLLGKLYE